MRCRICAANEVTEIGQVEYYSGFSWSVYDCVRCGCRFTKHDESLYDWLHSRPSSIYGLYRGLADKCKESFDRADLLALRRELSASAKYKFVINEVEQRPRNSKILEIGCGRGCITSYFILAGYKILGADISSEAISAARSAFGDHFVVSANPNAIEKWAPYDVIYHVGTIGCVSDPIGLTSELLRLLRPGGLLLFNSPNADACWFKRQLWIDAAPPPDLVTLFRKGFWGKHFGDTAEVTEDVETCSADQALEIVLRNAMARNWQCPEPMQLHSSIHTYQEGRRDSHNGNGTFAHMFERSIIKICRVLRLSRLAPKKPTPFGLFVQMIKK